MFIYFRMRMIVIMLLGITSGLPLPLSASTLAAMLMDISVDVTKIAVFGLASTPYVFKCLWAPLIDNLNIPMIGKLFGCRRSWILLSHTLLFITIVFVGLYTASTPNLMVLGIGVFCMAFFSATQDMVIDAYRIEILSDEDQGAGAAMATFGYRIGMLISSAGSLFIAEYLNWAISYTFIGICLFPGIIAVMLYGEPKIKRKSKSDFYTFFSWLKRSFSDPFVEFVKQKKWVLIILLVLLYKLSDTYIGMLTTPFLMDIGFSKIEIASVIKLYGFLAIIIGMFIGGYLISRYKNMGNILMIALFLQCTSNLVFVVQAIYGHNILVLIGVISAENFCSGLSSAALVAYISTIVKKEFAATHYAILSSLAVFGRIIISSSAGLVVEQLGWINFFYFASLLSLPAFICLYYLYYKKN